MPILILTGKRRSAIVIISRELPGITEFALLFAVSEGEGGLSCDIGCMSSTRPPWDAMNLQHVRRWCVKQRGWIARLLTEA